MQLVAVCAFFRQRLSRVNSIKDQRSKTKKGRKIGLILERQMHKHKYQLVQKMMKVKNDDTLMGYRAPGFRDVASVKKKNIWPL